MTTPSIEFRNVIKVYPQGLRQVTALDGLNLAINRGEFVAIMGPSGSGKSTALHLAGGLDLPTSGEVVVDGQPTFSLSENELTLLRRNKIGFVFQFFNLIPTLTIVENAALPALLGGKKRAEVIARAQELLAKVGLGARFDHFPEELSGGEMQRVAIVRALINDPPILLADEPTGNLDSATGVEILKLLQELAANRTIVIVTHDEKAAAYGSRTVRLKDGKLA
ncbi:ABC transporter ATP-binding protein [Candidatus Sumerlaeota bacterium]|nr:ABC transporter ATP-binding protein [Candidatus Sumerlaeota bacterium]